MRRSRAALIALAVLLAAAPSHAQRPDSAMVGAWLGSARVTVDWTVQKQIDVRVAIYADGSVTGMIGDASLVDAHLRSTRTFLQKALRLGTDYVIEAGLAGPIIRAESVQRQSVRIPLSWNGSAFTGTISTDGSFEGGRDIMRFTASDLVLRRAPTIVSTIK